MPNDSGTEWRYEVVILVCERCGMYTAARDDDWCDHCILEVEEILGEVDRPTEELMRHYYTVDDLERRVEEYEQEYGLPSETLLIMWEKGVKPVDLSNFDRHVWVSFYKEIMEKKYGSSE